ncbi:MAG: ATP synthase gamma chain [Candidatus Uhrbacteria bacterium GW2011_GWE2_40_58]|nr:MAG: ATP synthase gamma chain [Candidatus Uhrbacteria bacterium GW2011_GWF2_40_263]KKR67809.1 MAG: ATP synthase gamma chain [Candidatus Uhrbacteria bacterium GW2011_GWE2_40_58]OGL94516.1 MAG: ATP synthase F1 subunit gamma [Candidatus Uhrbacteria bacterium RIFOXYA2_FULL_40_9]OGL96767.1 MAG: ATP synthase F1 subunit gamma [Candidatus Uhrbacteria bacterium RIFOXYB2_FULL_41_18]HBK34483.1 ATP synthase F1 subunit gamma [Candidatus Uhrbacteria bacterium]
MAVQIRSIKRRIKSIKNTRKITKAMELVAASKMRKAVNAALETRPFALEAWKTILQIGSVTDTQLHPLLRQHKEIKKVLLLLVTSDRGLAGGFNANVIRKTIEQIDSYGKDVQIDAVAIGRRGEKALHHAGKTIIASFTEITNKPTYEEVLPIGRLVLHEFITGTYDKVVIAYTDFVSAIAQTPVIFDLLPLTQKDVLIPESDLKTQKPNTKEYLFEPSPNEVLDRMLPQLVETKVYQAILESAASEHSARMMAMRSASDSAGEMINELTFSYNQARQSAITQEIAEISSGKAALEQA